MRGRFAQIARDTDGWGKGQIVVFVLCFELNELRRVRKSAADDVVTDFIKIPRDTAAPAAAAQN